jgi:hypothetical protein
MIAAQTDPLACTPEDVVNNATALTAAAISQNKALQGNVPLRRNVIAVIPPLSTISSSAGMTVGQIRQLAKTGGLDNGRIRKNTGTAVTTPSTTGLAVMTPAMSQHSRTKRNRLALTSLSQGGAPPPPPPPPAESPVPFAIHPGTTNHPVTTSHPVATTPVTARTKNVRIYFLQSDIEAEEAVYDIMSNENDSRHAQIHQVIADTVSLGVDTPTTIKKIMRLHERWNTTAVAPSNGTD